MKRPFLTVPRWQYLRGVDSSQRLRASFLSSVTSWSRLIEKLSQFGQRLVGQKLFGDLRDLGDFPAQVDSILTRSRLATRSCFKMLESAPRVPGLSAHVIVHRV